MTKRTSLYVLALCQEENEEKHKQHYRVITQHNISSKWRYVHKEKNINKQKYIKTYFCKTTQTYNCLKNVFTSKQVEQLNNST
jgi:hypothetical protein